MRPLLIILILMFIVACLSDEEFSDKKYKEEASEKNYEKAYLKNSLNLPNITLYYFYSPTCPNCIAIESYMDYMINKSMLKYVLCNVKEFENCSKDSKKIGRAVATELYKKTGVLSIPTPTLVILEGKNATVFLGRDQVSRHDEYLYEKYNLTTFFIRFGEKVYKPSDCINCHLAKGLKEPSRFTCTACCHKITEGERADINIEIK